MAMMYVQYGEIRLRIKRSDDCFNTAVGALLPIPRTFIEMEVKAADNVAGGNRTFTLKGELLPAQEEDLVFSGPIGIEPAEMTFLGLMRTNVYLWQKVAELTKIIDGD